MDQEEYTTMSEVEVQNEPPTLIVSDYIQLTYLTLFFLVGAPVNIAAFFDLGASHNRAHRMHILKRNLNVSDLVILLIYVPSKVCWLITYKWQGGEVLCRFFAFANSMSFQLSSNIIVCIAFDRFLSVVSDRYRSCGAWDRRLVGMVSSAWLVAAVVCAPQLATWTVFEPFPDWPQCVSIWTPDLYLFKSNPANSNKTFYSTGHTVYTMMHSLWIFWIPLACIVVSYVCLTCWIAKNSRISREMELETGSPTGSMSRTTTNGDVQLLYPPPLPQITINSAFDPNLSLPTQGVMGSNNGENISTNGEIISNNGVMGFLSRNGSIQTSLLSDSDNDGKRRYHVSPEVTRCNKKAIRISVLLISAYVLCWLPYNLMSMWNTINTDHFIDHSEKLDFLHGLIVFNSVINPFLYGMFGATAKRYTRDG